jgi:hypothetical protein
MEIDTGASTSSQMTEQNIGILKRKVMTLLDPDNNDMLSDPKKN